MIKTLLKFQTFREKKKYIYSICGINYISRLKVTWRITDRPQYLSKVFEKKNHLTQPIVSMCVYKREIKLFKNLILSVSLSKSKPIFHRNKSHNQIVSIFLFIYLFIYITIKNLKIYNSRILTTRYQHSEVRLVY